MKLCNRYNSAQLVSMLFCSLHHIYTPVCFVNGVYFYVSIVMYVSTIKHVIYNTAHKYNVTLSVNRYRYANSPLLTSICISH